MFVVRTFTTPQTFVRNCMCYSMGDRYK